MDGQRTTTAMTGHDGTDGQRTDDDDGTNGRTEDDDGDDGTDMTGRTDGRTIYIKFRSFKYDIATKILT